MAPEAIAVIERDYLRLGVFGLIVARFLPGIRSVVPPVRRHVPHPGVARRSW